MLGVPARVPGKFHTRCPESQLLGVSWCTLNLGGSCRAPFTLVWSWRSLSRTAHPEASLVCSMNEPSGSNSEQPPNCPRAHSGKLPPVPFSSSSSFSRSRTASRRRAGRCPSSRASVGYSRLGNLDALLSPSQTQNTLAAKSSRRGAKMQGSEVPETGSVKWIHDMLCRVEWSKVRAFSRK